MKNDYKSLTHTKWRCQYHIVITPKYRRQIIYGKYKVEIGKILRTICERYEIEMIETNACLDHYPCAGGDTTKDVSIEIYGNIKRKKRPDDI